MIFDFTHDLGAMCLNLVNVYLLTEDFISSILLHFNLYVMHLCFQYIHSYCM